MANVPLPIFTDVVDQRFFIEPFGGPSNPTFYLDRFPEEVYHKAPDSHLVRFMYSLLGPAGVGWLHKNALEAKLRLYAMGLDLFDMEAFYSDPLKFSRILTERLNDNAAELLTREEWDTIRTKDESYRTRSTLFLNAVRLGTAPEGMRYAARSGLGHNVEIAEHYKWLFDSHSDEPKGFTRFGATSSTSEFVIIPRPEVSRQETQKITITGSPYSGFYYLTFKGKKTTEILSSDTIFDIKTKLEALPSIGVNNVKVWGGGTRGFGHQYTLVDNFVTDFSDWTFLLGSSGNWGYGVNGLDNNNTGKTHAVRTDITAEDARLISLINTSGGTSHSGIIAKCNGSNYLVFNYNRTSTDLEIIKYPGATILATADYDSAGANIYIRATTFGNDCTLDAFTTDPAIDPHLTPAATVTYSLTGSDATTYGLGVSGNIGVGTNFSAAQFIYNLSMDRATISDAPIFVTFTNKMANQDAPLIEVENHLNSGEILVESFIDGQEETDFVNIDVRNIHAMQTAIDHLRPVNSLPTTTLGEGTRTRQNWTTVQASSSYSEVIRFVTGQPRITWPSNGWIKGGVEKEAPRIKSDLQHHYVSYLSPASVIAYEDAAGRNPTVTQALAYPSVHSGQFNPTDAQLHPALNQYVNTNLLTTHHADHSLADYTEPLTVTANSNSEALINGIYPVSYAELPGAPSIKYNDEQFWASAERFDGVDYLEFDLGQSVPLNYIICETIHKPFNIGIEYDALGIGSERRFEPVTQGNGPFDSYIQYDPTNSSAWRTIQFEFTDSNGAPVISRYIRLKFERRINEASEDTFSFAWSVNIRNLRLGRNIVLS